MVSKTPDIKEIRIATIGNVDSGKSSLVGVLTKCTLDDGKGYARSLVMNFKHEIKSGKTSSIAHEILCFKKGVQVKPDKSTIDHGKASNTKKKNWKNLTSDADKIISLIDLCGHEKYLKTTIFGMTALVPDYALIVVGGNMGVKRITKEHVFIASALRIPFFVVITKIDFAPEDVLKQTKEDLMNYLKKINKVGVMVKPDESVETYTDAIQSNSITPIFCVSNKTGFGVEQLLKFIGNLSSRCLLNTDIRMNDENVEFHIESCFSVKNVGTIVSGILISGTVSLGNNLLIGPNSLGEFKPITIKSIHNQRNPVDEISAGNSCCFMIKSTDPKVEFKKEQVRKGMVILSKELNPKACRVFSAEVTILHCPTTIKEKYQPIIHCGVVRQAAQIIDMRNIDGDEKPEVIRGGESAIMKFKFIGSPEYVQEGNRILIRGFNTRGIGVIKKVDFDTKK